MLNLRLWHIHHLSLLSSPSPPSSSPPPMVTPMPPASPSGGGVGGGGAAEQEGGQSRHLTQCKMSLMQNTHSKVILINFKW